MQTHSEFSLSSQEGDNQESPYNYILPEEKDDKLYTKQALICTNRTHHHNSTIETISIDICIIEIITSKIWPEYISNKDKIVFDEYAGMLPGEKIFKITEFLNFLFPFYKEEPINVQPTIKIPNTWQSINVQVLKEAYEKNIPLAVAINIVDRCTSLFSLLLLQGFEILFIDYKFDADEDDLELDIKIQENKYNQMIVESETGDLYENSNLPYDIIIFLNAALILRRKLDDTKHSSVPYYSEFVIINFIFGSVGTSEQNFLWNLATIKKTVHRVWFDQQKILSQSNRVVSCKGVLLDLSSIERLSHNKEARSYEKLSPYLINEVTQEEIVSFVNFVLTVYKKSRTSFFTFDAYDFEHIKHILKDSDQNSLPQTVKTKVIQMIYEVIGYLGLRGYTILANNYSVDPLVLKTYSKDKLSTDLAKYIDDDWQGEQRKDTEEESRIDCNDVPIKFANLLLSKTLESNLQNEEGNDIQVTRKEILVLNFTTKESQSKKKNNDDDDEPSLTDIAKLKKTIHILRQVDDPEFFSTKEFSNKLIFWSGALFDLNLQFSENNSMPRLYTLTKIHDSDTSMNDWRISSLTKLNRYSFFPQITLPDLLEKCYDQETSEKIQKRLQSVEHDMIRYDTEIKEKPKIQMEQDLEKENQIFKTLPESCQKVSDLEQQLKSKDVHAEKLKEDLVKVRKENEKYQKDFEELQWHALENLRVYESQIKIIRTEYESKISSQQEEISKKVEKLSLAEKTITVLEERLYLLLKEHHHLHQLISEKMKEEDAKRDYEKQIEVLKSQFETKMWLKQEELSKKMKDLSVAEITITELKDNIQQLSAAAANIQDKIESQKTVQDQLTRANLQEIEDLRRNYEIKLKERSEEVEKMKNLMQKVILREARA